MLALIPRSKLGTWITSYNKVVVLNDESLNRANVCFAGLHYLASFGLINQFYYYKA